MPVIEVVDLWKRFRIPHERRASVLEQIAGALSVLEGKRFTYEEFWALRDMSFKLEHGESLGIIGPNGSGKSTLLKLMARIMKPDRGRIGTDGKIVPILELGIGFQGDLTVKENAVVYGVIMGIPRAQMKRRIESILDFAELARFQDARLKNLSSGMQVRLAFSIAVEAEADIFLVDEALSVGDMEFQKRCLARFRQFRKEGKSIVLVSHDMGLVKAFCEKTLYLLNGETRTFGPSDEVADRYIKDVEGEGHPFASHRVSQHGSGMM
jgi:lipopolysaccharide transport system ATP-binding protein